MVVIARTMKRPKRKATTDLHDFHEFPSSCSYDGPFRHNVVDFLERFARPPPPLSDLLPLPPHLRPWRVSLRVAGDEDVDGEAAVVDLDVVEEDVAVARSVFCDHCRVVGWSGHPVCGKRYHFIIRSGGNPAARVHQICIRCGTMYESSDIRCTNCNYELSAEDVEEWLYRQLEDSTHLLHGVVHSNGYGHLLRVNGREGGSKVLKGRDIMGFWDRFCTMLRVRKISVMDISKKYGLEYRLLHAITAGRTWYGEWGYDFGAGSFALTTESYLKALDTVSNMEISVLFSHNRGPRKKLHDVIAFYWFLSDRRLFTVRDLFCFLVELIDDAHQRMGSNISSTNMTAVNAVCPWSTDEVKCVNNAMVKILRAAGVGRWVSWRTLRGALSHSGASFQLLDYCLKGLTGRVTDDGLAVVSKCNADSNAIEYRLEASLDSPRNPLDPEQNSIQETCNRNPVANMCRPTEEQLIRDLRFLHSSLLNPDTMHSYKPRSTRAAVSESARILLDCKQFVKSYDICSAEHPNILRIWIEMVLLDEPQDYTIPPPELVVLPENANLGDLKLAVTRAFQETYLIFQKFQLQDIELGHVDDCTSIHLLLCDGCRISVRGRCHADHRLEQFRMERGIENWIVECICGARDDDGERMVACDSCSVWRHTRCMGIKDHEDVPKKFICWKCVRPPKVTVHPRRPNIKRSRDNATRISSKSISGIRIKAPMPLHKGSGKRCRFDGGDELVVSPTKSSLSCVYSSGDNGEGAYKIASTIPCISDAKLQGCGIDAGCGDRCKVVLMSPTKSDVNQLSCLTSVG